MRRVNWTSFKIEKYDLERHHSSGGTSREWDSMATQQQMADLFNATEQNVSLHINNIFEEGELAEDSVISKMETTDNKSAKQLVTNCDQLLCLIIHFLE